MNKEKLKEKLNQFKKARFGLDRDNDVEAIKERVLIEYDNDWHTISGFINELEALLEEEK